MADRNLPILIIGAGASGLMAAIAAARVRPHSVLLLEKESRVGRKLLATGNGRCNLMNMAASHAHYHGDNTAAAQKVLAQWPPERLLATFDAMGLRCREESAGRVYPYSGQASAVLDVLRTTCERAGVTTRTETEAIAIEREADAFRITTQAGETLPAARVIVAGGGKAAPAFGANGQGYRLLAMLGHTLIPASPAIVPLKLPPHRIRGLKGVRTQAALSLYVQDVCVETQTGEALFTDYGVSGIVAMQLARQVHKARQQGKQPQLSIALMSPEIARTEIEKRASLYARAPAEMFFTGLLHKRIALCLLREAGIELEAPMPEHALGALETLLSDWRLPVQGTLSLEHAQVTAGGIALDEFDPQTLSSRLVPGLYACGETLDVDGDCGGYNLMWAWASGLVAGTAAAESLQEECT